MLDLSNILKFNSDNIKITTIFNWLYANLKAYNNYDDEKILYLIKDEFKLQIKRSEQCDLTIKALNNTKDNETNYLYIRHKNKLFKLIKILKEQNNKLLESLKIEIVKLEEQINLKTNEIDSAFNLLKQKQSYKNNFIYEEYFSILNNFMKKLVTYEKNDFIIHSDVNVQLLESLKKIKTEAKDFNFEIDNIINLSDFGLENKNYYIYYETFRSFSFNKADILKKYSDQKDEKEKNVLCSIVAIPKNIHQIMKMLLNLS